MPNWLQALQRTRRRLGSALAALLPGVKRLDESVIEDLEVWMVQADAPPRLVDEWMAHISRRPGSDVHDTLRELLLAELGEAPSFAWRFSARPHAILVVGVNGSGKTTTCAKLARKARDEGLRPLLGAADTFRAAGSEQLRKWADMVGCEVVVGATGADPAAVAYDAVDAAVARKVDVVLVDTAGRMHTRQPLMAELDKIRRAMQKKLPEAPHDVWLVLDAALGQNAVAQARMFHEAVQLSGVIVSKLDGSSKAGFLFSIRRELGVPILFAGLGEGQEDLVPFSPAEFVDALLSPSMTASSQEPK